MTYISQCLSLCKFTLHFAFRVGLDTIYFAEIENLLLKVPSIKLKLKLKLNGS